MLQDRDSMIGRNKKGRSNIQNTHEKFRMPEDFWATDLKIYAAHILINCFKLDCILFRISKIARKSTDLDPKNTDRIYFSVS